MRFNAMRPVPSPRPPLGQRDHMTHYPDGVMRDLGRPGSSASQKMPALAHSTFTKSPDMIVHRLPPEARSKRGWRVGRRRAAVVPLAIALMLASCGDDPVSEANRAAAPTAIPAPAGQGPDGIEQTLEVVDGGPETGFVMTDHRGFAVYGTIAETPDVLVCIDECTDVWLPLEPRGNSVHERLDPEKFGTFERPDGTQQVTYNNIPLYLWTGDSDVGVTGGAGVAGTWFALTSVAGFFE